MLGRKAVLIGAGVAVAVTAYAAGFGTATVADSDARQPRAAAVIGQAVTSIESHAARPVPASALERAAVQGMLSALDDHWATYYSARDFRHFQQVLGGGYTGVGVWLRRTDTGRLQVVSVQPGSPAKRAGLRAGDRILAVAGQPVGEQSVAAITDQLRGRPRSVVQLTVTDPAGSVRSMKLRRAKVSDHDVTVSMLTPTVERIRIDAFTSGVGEQVRTAVREARAHDDAGIVLDLRDDPGGLLDEAVETASAFLSGGPVVTYVQRGQPRQTLDALGRGDTGIPLVVLVDGGTASAAEIVAAALQDRGRAVLLGSQTFGKGTVQAPQRLSDGSAIELTVGQYLTPSGQSLQGSGITPDVLIPPGTPGATVKTRALEVLSGLTADAGSTSRG